jgi:Flp pilus assembly protein TadG
MSFTRTATPSRYNTIFKRKRLRSGTAVTECAICLPLVMLISLATIDVSSALFLKESLTIAAYEGARVGALRGGTNASARGRISEILDSRGIQYQESSITFSAPGFDQSETLVPVSTTIQVLCEGNMPITGALFRGRSVSASVTFRKEYQNEIE